MKDYVVKLFLCFTAESTLLLYSDFAEVHILTKHSRDVKSLKTAGTDLRGSLDSNIKTFASVITVFLYRIK